MKGHGRALKVGHSVNPEQRRKQLGGHLKLVHTGLMRGNAARIENLTQRLLTIAGKHVGGELFLASLADVKEAIARAERIADGLEPEPIIPRPPKARKPRVPQIRRVRAAWRFDPRFLKRFRHFTAKQDLQVTQTQIIEVAVTEYMDRKEGREARR